VERLFPFLIGRIRTCNKSLILSPLSMFPFLIGRIRTYIELDVDNVVG